MEIKNATCTGRQNSDVYRRQQNEKLILGALLLALVIAVPVPTMAGVDVSVNIGLPPPIVFAAPPDVDSDT